MKPSGKKVTSTIKRKRKIAPVGERNISKNKERGTISKFNSESVPSKRTEDQIKPTLEQIGNDQREPLFGRLKEKIFVLNNNFLGSTISMLLAVISMIAVTYNRSVSLSYESSFEPRYISGVFIILGALAYRSAKKRKLGIAKNIGLRKVLEIIALSFIFIALIISNPAEKIENYPLDFLLIPIWIFIAYGYVMITR